MTDGSIVPRLISFAIPLFLGNIFQQFYNTVDCFIIGKYLGSESLAAIGSTSQLVFIIIGFFNGFATGTQVVISQLFGAKNLSALKKAISTAIFSSFILGIFMTFLGLFISPLLLKLIQVPENVSILAQTYLTIYFAGILFLILYNLGSGILRALGDSKTPLYFLILSSLINIILDLVFVLVLKLGVAGAAWATIISEFISIIPVYSAILSIKEFGRFSFRNVKFDTKLFGLMMKIGLPGAVSSSINSFSNTFMQKYVNAFGTSCIAGWSIFARYDQFMIMPMISISLATTTFVSQNFGAKKIERINKGVKSSFFLMISIIFILSFLIFVFSETLSAIFISDKASVLYASLFIRYTAPFYVLCATCMLFSQALRGFGDSFIPTIIIFCGFVLLRQFILFVGTKYSESFGLVAIAYPVVWVITSMVMFGYYETKISTMCKKNFVAVK